MDWEEYFADAAAMAAGAQARLDVDKARIRYVNGCYKCYGQPESRWLYNIAFAVDGGQLVITELERDSEIRLPLEEVAYLKLRPYYFAACIGRKAFVFYAYPEDGGSDIV